MSIQPEGEEIRRATAWLSEQRQTQPQAPLKKLIEAACLKFDLSPLEADFLSRTLSEISPK
jgi:hypothetical protein